MIEIKHVTKTFGNKTAVDHIDPDHTYRRDHWLHRPNGAGKTTTHQDDERRAGT